MEMLCATGAALAVVGSIAHQKPAGYLHAVLGPACDCAMALSGLQKFTYALGVIYCALGAWATVQVAWVHYYSKPMTLQKAFHLVIMAVAAGM